jgi:hypothetical protein
VRVDWAIISRYAETADGTATIVGAGIDTFGVQSFPAPITLALTIQLRGQQQELAQPHQLSLRILDDELDQLGDEVELSFQTEPNPQLQEGWEAGAMFAAVNQIVVEHAGTFSIEIGIDGEHKKSLPFRVLSQEPEEPAV